jgi:segregation and condensation protein A
MTEIINNDEQSGSEKYVLSIDNFDGPLELLWTLIKDAKIDITEISISQITEQYINFLKLMEVMNIQIASEFIVMASELLYYKSKTLLPGSDIEDEYFVQPLPPDLIQKLLEYKKYQSASAALREFHDAQADLFTRNNIPGDGPDEEGYIEVSLFDLLSAFSDVIDSQETIEQEEIVFDEILVIDKINFIIDLLNKKDQIVFSELFPLKPGRPEIIATFLALLEMAKTSKIRLMQHVMFGEIRIFRAYALGGV